MPAISSIVFLDAFLPDNGQKVVDMSPPALAATSLAAVARNEVSRPVPPAKAFGVNEKDQPWVDGKTTPQPTLVSVQPIVLTGARDKVAKKTYIRATSYPNPKFDEHFAKLKGDQSWRTFGVPSGHDVMVDMPERLAEILMEVA